MSVAERLKTEVARETAETTVDVGSIFCFSWGYEQTNIDFFQVVRRTTAMLELRAIKAEQVPGSGEGQFMADRCVAVKDAFLETRCDVCSCTSQRHDEFIASNPDAVHEFVDKSLVKKRLQFTRDGKPFIKMASYGWCGLWNGTPEHRSWYH